MGNKFNACGLLLVVLVFGSFWSKANYFNEEDRDNVERN